MDFDLSDSEQMLVDSARSFLAGAATQEALSSSEQSDDGYDIAVWEEISALGWAGIAVPESLGGGGGNLVHVGLVLEEVGRSALASPLRECATVASILSVVAPGAARTKQIIDRSTRGSVSVLMSPDRGRLPVFCGSVQAAPVLVDWAATAETILSPATDASGEKLLLVEIPAAQSGVSIESVRTFDNGRCASVALNGAEALVVCDPLSPRQLDETYALASLLRIAELLGASAAAAEMTLAHVKSRVQFAHPIGSFQAVRHKCADMAMDLDGVRLTTYEALWQADNGLDFVPSAAAATIFGAAACERIAWTASQLHGGAGFMTAHPLHRHFLRIKAGQLRLGTPEEINMWAAKALLAPGRDLSPFPTRMTT